MKRLVSLVLTATLFCSMACLCVADEIISVTISVYETVNNEFIVSPVRSSVVENSTALSILKDTVTNVETDGDTVVSVRGFAAKQHGENSGWVYKINGETQTIPPASYILQNDDSIEWIYEVGTESTTAPTTTAPITTQQTTAPQPTTAILNTTVQPQNNTRTTSDKTDNTKSDEELSTGETSETSTTEETTSTTQKSTAFVRPSTTRALSSDFNGTLAPALEYLEENPGDYTTVVLSLFDRKISDSIKKSIRDKAHDKSLSLQEKQLLFITISAIGEDPSTFSSLELTKQVYSGGNLLQQGLDKVIYALLTVPYADLTGDEDYTADSLIELILQNQNTDGSFAKTYNSAGDVDITALALTALSAYQTNASVSLATDRALAWLSTQQNEDGTFEDVNGVKNCYSTAYVLMALSSLEMRVEEDNLIQNSASIFDALLLFFNGTAFTHRIGGTTSVADTESVLLAVAAYQLQINPLSVDFETVSVSENLINPWVVGFCCVVIVVVIIGGLYYRKKKKKSGDISG